LGGHDADSVGSQLDSSFSVNKEASGEVALIVHNVPPEVLGGLQRLVTTTFTASGAVSSMESKLKKTQAKEVEAEAKVQSLTGHLMKAEE